MYNDIEIFYKTFEKDPRIQILYPQIKDLHIDDPYLYYYQARGAFECDHNYKEAEKLIIKCLDLFESGNFILKHFSKIVPKLLTQKIFTQKYMLAGQIFAQNGKKQESLEAYIKYIYWIEQVENETFKEKQNVILYSFRRINQYTLADLINNEITVCSPSRMNDPFDSWASFWSKPEHLDKICKLKEKKEFIHIYSQAFKYFRIRSFVANRETYEADDSILQKIPMWSFYADEHRGMCIRYSLSRHFIKRERKNIQENKYCHTRIFPIKYGPEIKLNEKPNTDIGFGYKNKFWEPENEVRLLSYNPTTESDFFGEPIDELSHIEEITFGLFCEEKNMETVYNLVHQKYPQAQFYKMEIDTEQNNLYELRKRKYEKPNA